MPGNTESNGEGPAAWWNERYESEDMPWDTGEPQSALVDAVAEHGLSGRVLDIGCGTGTHALWAAERGHPAVGVDISERGIERAQARAADRDLDVRFQVGNALDLDDDLGTFGTVLDSGLFHAFEADGHATYAAEVAEILESGGRLFLVGFGPGAPTDFGPVPMSPADVRRAFADGWRELVCREATFETRAMDVSGLLAVFERD
ncbi:SAM-dependent methyltransferase [Haloglomus litoreum]|uniref:SAM-dependent methyltransferase n=1 Tax=Haloglomus litoreum TaxID=3034026 RepID=UPI0023E8CFB3|nr:class I SAM-dependent methyltransferase [Haloglomus sp. DT116]